MPTGRTAAGQRPADRGQWRVSVGQDQPGLNGDAPQVHVHGGQQARNDPTHCGPEGSEEERGKGPREKTENILWAVTLYIFNTMTPRIFFITYNIPASILSTSLHSPSS